MSHWYTPFLQAALSNPGQNGARDFGIEITPTPGAEWTVSVYKLPKEINANKHNIFVGWFDGSGNRLPGECFWTWEGRNEEKEPIKPVMMNKPESEPGGDIAIHWGQKISIWLEGGGRKISDVAGGFTTAFDGAGGDNRGHISYIGLFVPKSTVPLPPPPPPVAPPVDPGTGLLILPYGVYRIYEDESSIVEVVARPK